MMKWIMCEKEDGNRTTINLNKVENIKEKEVNLGFRTDTEADKSMVQSTDDRNVDCKIICDFIEAELSFRIDIEADGIIFELAYNSECDRNKDYDNICKFIEDDSDRLLILNGRLVD